MLKYNLKTLVENGVIKIYHNRLYQFDFEYVLSNETEIISIRCSSAVDSTYEESVLIIFFVVRYKSERV